MPRIGGALDVAQISADPSSPSTGRSFLYFKSDGVLYSKAPDGTVVPLGAAPANMVTTDTTQTISGTKTFSSQITRFGQQGVLAGVPGQTLMVDNAVTSDGGANYTAINTGACVAVQLANGALNIYTAPSVAAGALVPFSVRAAFPLAGGLDSKSGNIITTGLSQAGSYRATSSGGTTIGKWSGMTTTGAPTSGSYSLGDWIVARDTGRVWMCTVTGTPGTWVEQLPPSNMLTTDTTQTVTGNKTFTGNLVIGNKALWNGTRTLPGANNTIDLGTFSSAQGAFQLNAMFTVDAAGFSVTKTYEIDVAASVDAANTWYKVLPQDSTNFGGAANDFTLEVNRNATTNAYTFRIRQIGATGGTLYWQIEGWGDNTLAYAASSATTVAPAAVATVWSPAPLYTGPGRVGINTDSPTVAFDVNGAINSSGNITENGNRVWSAGNQPAILDGGVP